MDGFAEPVIGRAFARPVGLAGTTKLKSRAFIEIPGSLLDRAL